MRGAGKRTEHDRHRQSISSSMTLDSHNDECSRFHLFMGGTILLLISIEWPVARLVRLEGFGQLRHCIFGTATLLTVIAYCHWRNYYRLRESAILAVWLVWLTITLNILMQICGRSPAPLVDLGLSRIDAAMHFSALSVMKWIHSFRYLRVALILAYVSLPLLMLLALMLPTLQGKYRQSRQYIVAVTIAALFTAAIFALWPAVGPWVVYGYKPAPDQTAAQDYLLALKSTSSVRMNMDVAAIVSFPSFHVVLALLSAAGLWQCRKFRPLLVALSTAICISTVTTGWHYMTDVLGGFAVTATAYPLANRLLGTLLTPATVYKAHPIPRPSRTISTILPIR